MVKLFKFSAEEAILKTLVKVMFALGVCGELGNLSIDHRRERIGVG